MESLPPWEVISRALAAANERLGTDVAVVAEFAEGRRVIRAGSGDLDGSGLSVGGPHRDAGYSMTATVRLSSGEAYGTLWAARRDGAPSSDPRDVDFLALLANLIAEQIERERTDSAALRVIKERVAAALDDAALAMVFQPIVDLTTGAWRGAESLARFSLEPRRTPDVWFKEAFLAGVGEQLELNAVRKALDALAVVPATMYVAVNVSPETLLGGGLSLLLEHAPPERVVVEITEHAAVADYDAIEAALAPLRARGVRLAVDDAGSGYASMTHILRLRPDIIKLDGFLTNGIESDPARRALAGAMVSFGAEIGARIVAEVVETAESAEALRALGVHTAQGWYFAKPMPAEEISAAMPAT